MLERAAGSCVCPTTPPCARPSPPHRIVGVLVGVQLQREAVVSLFDVGLAVVAGRVVMGLLIIVLGAGVERRNKKRQSSARQLHVCNRTWLASFVTPRTCVLLRGNEML